jgi:sugar lactone lactonase YvrE
MTDWEHVAVKAVCVTVAAFLAVVAQPRTTELWETKAELRVPESVVYDSGRSALYVSNVDGAPDAKDSKGFVAKLSLDGAIEKLEWVKGLNAPKGMAINGNTLYLSDITELVEIDIAKGAVTKRYAAADAQFLNDVTVDRNGMVYVSDMSAKNSAVYRLAAGNLSVWLRVPEITQPNGMCFANNKLMTALSQTGEIYSAALNRTLKKIGRASFGIDGIVPDGGTGFIVSDFDGRVAHISNEFGEMPLLDTREEGRNAADIEYVSSKHLLLVPTFKGNTVVAYQVDGLSE